MPSTLTTCLEHTAPAFKAIVLCCYAVLLPACDWFTDDDDKEGVRVAWSHPKAVPHDHSVQPVVEDGQAYAAFDGALRAYDARSGRLVWSTTYGDVLPPGRNLPHDGGPDGTLYLELRGEVRAYSKADGALKWRASLADFPGVGLREMAHDDEHLYVAGRGAVQQVRKADGALGRRFSLEGVAPQGTAELVYDPAVSNDGLLYVPTAWESEDTGIHGAVYCLDVFTGQEVWRYVPPPRQLQNPPYEPYWVGVGGSGADVLGDRVFVTTTSQVIAFDRTNGEVMWSFDAPAGSGGFWVRPTAAGDGVYAGAVTQRVYKFDADTGEIEWVRVLDGSVTPTITLMDGRVYFTNAAWGEVWIVDDGSGDVVWKGLPPEHEKNDAIYLSPLGVGEESMMVVGNKAVYGLTRP